MLHVNRIGESLLQSMTNTLGAEDLFDHVPFFLSIFLLKFWSASLVISSDASLHPMVNVIVATYGAWAAFITFVWNGFC